MNPLIQSSAVLGLPSLFDFPVPVQDSVRAWQTVAEAAQTDLQAAVRAFALTMQGRPGYSEKRIYAKLAAYRETADWTIFLDKRGWSDLWARQERASILPAEFVRYAGGQMLGNQRKSRPAHRALLRRWQAWRAAVTAGRSAAGLVMPGYAECPPPAAHGKHPLGWSYSNLMRVCQPPKAELAIARIGSAAAKGLLPCVPGTRIGARWLEYVFFDDVVRDRKVTVPGYLTPVRVLQLGCLDLATDIYLKFGQRPDLPADDGHRERLKRHDFLCLVAAFLDEYGYPAEYDMHLIVERGTATMSAAEARVLYDLSGGRIKVCYTSMLGQMVMAWAEQSTGNASGKAVLESWHNLLHNEDAFFPGQVGMDRNHCPSLLPGQEREAVALGKAASLLPADQRAQLRFPLANLLECYYQTLDVVARINGRTDHECEGFNDVVLWRIAGTRDWHPQWEQPAQVDPAALEFSSRKESPLERRARLSAGVPMLRLPRNIWPRFYDDSHALCTFERGQVIVRHQGRDLAFGPDTPEGCPPDGAELLAYFAPDDPQVVHLTLKGRYLASWPRLTPIRRGDAQGLSAAIRRKQTWLNAAVKNVQAKRAEEILRQDARMQHNLDVIASAGLGAGQPEIAPANEAAQALQTISRRMSTTREAEIDRESLTAFAEETLDQ